MTRRFVLAALALLSLGAQAQAPGNCALGHAERDLDIGDVLARVFTTGSLFFGNSSQAAYLVPRLSGRSPLFAAGIWVGGLMSGELRVAGATYADFEFWPGPIDPDTGRPPDPEDCSDYDRIWRVSRGDVERYYRTGEATDDLAEWPYELGAPVLDGDGDPSNYDLAAGDQPAVSGDQTLWWVMNDVGNEHANTLLPPIGLEVQATAFAFADGPPALRQATFYRYRLINRSPVALESAYLSFFADPDLGDAADDYVGSDTLRDFAFVYNADNQDGQGGGTTYGLGPPSFGTQFVQGPIALTNDRDDDRDGVIDEAGERLGMTALMVYYGGIPVPQTDPRNGAEMYQAMQGRWTDGTPMTVGGSGYNPQVGGPITTMAFPGDPVLNRFWSERCPSSPCGAALPPGDRRFALSTGPFEIAAGSTEDVLIALVFGQGGSNLDSVVELRAASAVVRTAYETGLLDPHIVPGYVPPALPLAIEIRRPAPNPFTDSAVLRLSVPAEADVRIALVDVLGREVAVLADEPHTAGPHEVVVDGALLTPGVYLARVWVNGQAVAALPLTRTR